MAFASQQPRTAAEVISATGAKSRYGNFSEFYLYLHYHFGELPYRLFFFGDVSLITLLSLSVLNALRNYTFRDLNRGTKTST